MRCSTSISKDYSTIIRCIKANFKEEYYAKLVVLFDKCIRIFQVTVLHSKTNVSS